MDCSTHGQITPQVVQIKTSGTFNYVGTARYTYNNATHFLHNHVEGDIDDSITDFLTKIPPQEAIWLTIRVSKPNHNFDTPRWHRDGRMWLATGSARKYVVTLAGPDTLLLPETLMVTKHMAPRNYEERREELASALADEPRIIVPPHTIISFTCGEHNSQVHSEPPHTTDRIFISALPGTEEQLRSLATIRGLCYVD